MEKLDNFFRQLKNACYDAGLIQEDETLTPNQLVSIISSKWRLSNGQQSNHNKMFVLHCDNESSGIYLYTDTPTWGNVRYNHVRFYYSSNYPSKAQIQKETNQDASLFDKALIVADHFNAEIPAIGIYTFWSPQDAQSCPPFYLRYREELPTQITQDITIGDENEKAVYVGYIILSKIAIIFSGTSDISEYDVHF